MLLFTEEEEKPKSLFSKQCIQVPLTSSQRRQRQGIQKSKLRVDFFLFEGRLFTLSVPCPLSPSLNR